MNTFRIVVLPILKRMWSSNSNKGIQQFVQNSILVSQITNGGFQRISYYCTESSTTSTNPHNKHLLTSQQLEIYSQNPENKKHYQMVQLEIEVMRQNGENVPNNIKDRQMIDLLFLDSRNKRRKYLEFLFIIEKKKENRKNKPKEFEMSELQREQSHLPNYLQYKLGCNAPFLRFRETTMNRFYNWNLMKAMMYGQKLIIDCSFEDKMTRQEVKNCAKQLMLSFGVNRVHSNPLDITLCNVDKESYLHEQLLSYIPTMYDDHFPMTISEKSYIELFNPNKLIYLTPDSNEVLQNYDYNAIYIIGAIVDKVSGRSDTLAKAKRDNIRHAKLPIDKYLRFGSGSKKALTLNQVTGILADLQHTQDWNYAFRHVPKRKLFEYRLKDMENRIKKFCDENKHESFKLMGEAVENKFDIKSRKKFRYNKKF